MKRKVLLGVMTLLVIGSISGCGEKGAQPPQQTAVTQKEEALAAPTPGTMDGTIEKIQILAGIEGHPSGIAVLEKDTLLVTDTFNKVIWEIRDGEARVLAGQAKVLAGQSGPKDLYGEPLGGYSDTTLEEARFQKPWDIAPFLGGWAVSDSENRVIRYFNGEVVRTAAYKNSERLLVNPTGLTADQEGNLYIADAGTGILYRMDEEGILTAVADGFQDPTGLCWSKGILYVADTGNHRICAVEEDKVTVIAGGEEGFADGRSSEAAFRNPQGIAVGEDGTIYVADTGNSAVRSIKDGSVKTLLVCGEDSTWPVAPRALCLYQGGLVVADEFSGVIFTMPCD